MRKILLGSLPLIALVAGPAFAADMPIKARQPVVEAYSWSGFYTGGTLGYAWGSDDYTHSTMNTTTAPVAGFAVDSAALTAAGSPTIHPRSASAGSVAGYNWQAGAMVLGAEIDYTYIGASRTQFGVQPFPSTPGTSFQVLNSVTQDWMATARGRLGWANDNWMIYVTGGGAFTRIKTEQSLGSLVGLSTGIASFSSSRTGWVVGGGVERILSGPWTVRVEYLHADFGTVTGAAPFSVPTGVTLNTSCTGSTASVAGPASTPCTLSNKVAIDTVRAALTYRWGGNTVVARY